ncbi:prephenate dehydratase [Nafulsella turpanensis]|uniref:prephenate dehydratase n=1 Tax=Nafulsella turpanensis TaxID=1265690 RepID=UPI000344AF41|nr:prephenate dehydratase [Nafulsella turpanensis]
MEKELDALRQKIDAIDDQLLQLLNARMEVVREVGVLKQSSRSVIYRPEREAAIIERLHQKTQGLLNREAIEAVFLEIFALSRNLELPEKVAYLGPDGSFTHGAAESRFGALSEYLPMLSIKAVFEAVQTDKTRFGVVPIENNQEGIVVETMDCLQQFNLRIVAELPQPIHFCLASASDRVEELHTLYSKDIAFRQCREFTHNYFPKGVQQVPVSSTSEAARLAEEKGRGHAALCSAVAAKRFKLPVLFHNVEDADTNMTRFLILAKDIVNQPGKNDKTTLLAHLPDQPGSLAAFLQDFHKASINLTKIESRPVRGEKSFNYWFFIEFDGHRDDPAVQQILEKHQQSVRWLGSYVKML